MTHNKKERFDHIFYCVFWASFLNLLLLSRSCYLYGFDVKTDVFSTFSWTSLTVSPRFIYYSIRDIILRNLHVFVSVCPLEFSKVCCRVTSPVLGLVCCSPLKITFMLPACSPRFNLSLDKVRKAFYRGEIHISAHFCHCNDSDSGWQRLLKA